MALRELDLRNKTYPADSDTLHPGDYPASTITGWREPYFPPSDIPSGVKVLQWLAELASGTVGNVGLGVFEETPTAGMAIPDDLERLRKAFEEVVSNIAPFAAFDRAVREIDWEAKSPSAFEQAINMALQLEALVIARELARLGHEKYPGDASLASAAHVLAPPRVIERNRPPKKGLSASMAWFEKHAGEYRDHWIAIQAGELIGVALSRAELMEDLGDKGSASDVLIAHIP